MSESVTISRKIPKAKSQQYDLLRDEGINHIQKLAGKIWTDYNIHDPGISILEVLCYAITDLGYRTSFNMEDLLANAPDNLEEDIKNFYTAREILPNAPVTINDYRKLLIDVNIEDSLNENCAHVGVKNAWIEKSDSNEIPVYVHPYDSKLSYDPCPCYVPTAKNPTQPPLDIGILYDILIEFEKCDEYGDLNENSISRTLVVEEFADDPNLVGLEIKISVNFPRWDNEDIDWEDNVSIRSGVQRIHIRLSKVPDTYSFTTKLINNLVKLEGKNTSSSDVVDVSGIEKLEKLINDFIYYNQDSLLAFYLLKIEKISEIVEKVKARLHANRNLCEDFYKLSALKVEKIAVCADIELEQEADVEDVLARIYHEIGKFLSPTVHFYTLDEMLDKCRYLNKESILKIDKSLGYFKINRDVQELISENETVTITDSRSNDGDYTVKSVVTDSESATSKVYVEEEIVSDLLTENESFSFYTKEEDDCYTVDKIFEGPALEHGFIDDNELEKADRKKFIHVSDLIQIIMDVEGVIAVKDIQIANIPQDNEDGSIESKSVKWCLQLAYQQNYVPRLSKLDSKVTFYKDRLPFKAAESIVEEKINELEDLERTSKLFNPKLDFEIPAGKYRNTENYESIQNDFPLVYGIGEEGLPTLANDKTANDLREAKARQLKGFLMHFDQLLANYFSQLAHIKDLFSMNAQKDEFGNYLIGRTYYTQPLFDIVPNAENLYVDKAGHAVALNEIAESEELFLKRKNRFLDHLIARFAENFTDYAMLTFKLSGENRGREDLIEDKLAFLNSYPSLSSGRGKGFNHQSSCNLWHVDNISGLRQRVSFLTGINETQPEELQFNSNFEIVKSGDEYTIQVSNGVPEILLKSFEIFDSEEEAKLSLEKMIINGVSKENYAILTDDETNYYFQLLCGEDEVLGVSEIVNYTDISIGGQLDNHIDGLVQLFENEYYNNLESNRNNLACAVLNYIQYSIEVDMVPDPPEAIISFDLYSEPLRYNSSDKVLSGSFKVLGESKSEVDIVSVNTSQKQITVDGNIASKLYPGAKVVIKGSVDNDGDYTVTSAVDDSDKTKIKVEEAIPSNTAPRGELLYNNETEDELMAKANKKLPEILWQLIDNASNKGKYYFTDEDGPYKFKILKNAGSEFAASVESDFNDLLADEIANLNSGKIIISDSTDNDGEYTILSSIADGPDVTINISENLPTTTADGTLSFTEKFGYSVDLENNTFIVSANLTGKLYLGDSIQIENSKSNDGTYTIFAIDFKSGKTRIIVEEPIPADIIVEDGETEEEVAGELVYTKSFEIDEVTPNSVTFKGGYDVQSVELFIEFIKDKFFSREGFHILEHVLLRPKIKGDHFVAANTDALTEGLPNPGRLYFKISVPLYSSSEANDWFKIDGDHSNDLDALKSTDISSVFEIDESEMNDGFYTVKGVTYDAVKNRTEIRTKEPVPQQMLHPDVKGNLFYYKGTTILSLSAENLTLTVNDAGTLELNPGEIVEIRGSTDEINNGRYLVDEVIDNGASQDIVLSHVELPVEDRLLSIVLEEGKCDDCQIKDPYTCIAHIVLPQWQGRFDKMDFRRFMERQLRLETPAHVFLVICWINCEQMTDFEKKYKAWLVEDAKIKKDEGLLSARLNDLIDILEKIRNVYPSGTLHDCEEDETLENAIILDNSVLGNV